MNAAADASFVHCLRAHEIDCGRRAPIRLAAGGESVCQPPGIRHRENTYSDDAKQLEIEVSVDLTTEVVASV